MQAKPTESERPQTLNRTNRPLRRYVYDYTRGIEGWTRQVHHLRLT